MNQIICWRKLTSCFIKRVIFVCWKTEYLSPREGIFVVWKDGGQLQPFHSQRWRLNQVRDVIIRKCKTIIVMSKSLHGPKMFKWIRVLKRLHGHVWRGKKRYRLIWQKNQIALIKSSNSPLIIFQLSWKIFSVPRYNETWSGVGEELEYDYHFLTRTCLLAGCTKTVIVGSTYKKANAKSL